MILIIIKIHRYESDLLLPTLSFSFTPTGNLKTNQSAQLLHCQEGREMLYLGKSMLWLLKKIIVTSSPQFKLGHPAGFYCQVLCSGSPIFRQVPDCHSSWEAC